MTGCNYRAQPLGRKDIRAYAKRIRRILHKTNEEYFDIIRVAEIFFPAIFGDRYSFEILSREEMGNNHGLTNPETGRVMIREDIYEGACRGEGRDRLTIAHELGHFLLHNGITLGLARVVENEKVPTYCNPEWQATAFAGELLMDSDIIRDMTVPEISKKCGVSIDAASFQKRH